jgi:protein-tyrosine phosphatase
VADVFRVLFVCTGNICRSPTAERLLRHALRERLGDDGARQFDVTSAGVGAMVGDQIQEYAAALLTDRGVDTAGFAARQLGDGVTVADADLVLAMTREHRVAVASDDETVIPRLFTLREFARLAAAADPVEAADAPARARALVAAAAAMRGRVRPERPADDDVPDPYGRGPDAYELPFTLIDEAITGIADLFAAAGAR